MKFVTFCGLVVLAVCVFSSPAEGERRYSK